jgi:hypothetical protein
VPKEKIKRYFLLPIGDVPFLEDNPELEEIIDSSEIGEILVAVIQAIPRGFWISGALKATPKLMKECQVDLTTGYCFAKYHSYDTGLVGEYHTDTQRRQPTDEYAVFVENKRFGFFSFHDIGKDYDNFEQVDHVKEIIIGLLRIGYRSHLFFLSAEYYEDTTIHINFFMYKHETRRESNFIKPEKPGDRLQIFRTNYYIPPCIEIEFDLNNDYAVKTSQKIIEVCQQLDLVEVHLSINQE